MKPLFAIMFALMFVSPAMARVVFYVPSGQATQVFVTPAAPAPTAPVFAPASGTLFQPIRRGEVRRAERRGETFYLIPNVTPISRRPLWRR